MVRRALLAVLLGGLLLTPASVAAGNGIAYCEGGLQGSACPGTPTTTSGVYFIVTAGGGNRSFASVSVSCTDSGAVVYSTVLTVQVPAKGTGTSQVIYPPVSSCTADLVKLNQIGSARVLATTTFTVS